MRIFLFILCVIPLFLYSQTPVGRWDFDNPDNLLQATIGNNLSLVGSHVPITGPSLSNGAASIGIGSYYKCNHGMAANGGGSKVNEYTVVIDFKIPQDNLWHSLMQTNYQNTDDGDIWIATDRSIGVFATGYSFNTINPNTWYRLVIAVDLGSTFKYYINGSLFYEGSNQMVDGRFSLYPSDPLKPLLFFADYNGQDNTVMVSMISIYSSCLTASQVSALGGVGSIITLSTPTNLTVSKAGNQVHLQWDQVSGATLYHIYETDIPTAVNWGMPVVNTYNKYYNFNVPLQKAFYRVTAE